MGSGFAASVLRLTSAGTAKSLHFETPQPDELRRILHVATVQADIRKASLPRIVLVVQTPKGEIVMS